MLLYCVSHEDLATFEGVDDASNKTSYSIIYVTEDDFRRHCTDHRSDVVSTEIRHVEWWSGGEVVNDIRVSLHSSWLFVAPNLKDSAYIQLLAETRTLKS